MARRRRALAVVALAAAWLVGPAVAQAAGPQVTVLYPLAGKLTSSPLESPPHHHYWGNFAVDAATGAGTPVYARFANANGTLTLSIAGTFDPCATAGAGGSGVIVNVAINGQAIGRVHYAHLSGIVKGSGAINNGDKIGVLYNGGSTSCWTGPHTHVEPRSYTGGTACFVARGLNSSFDANAALGVIGAYTGGDNQTCPAGAENGAPGGTPADGTLINNRGHVYRMAGGAPVYVSNWAAVGGPQPTTTLSDGEFDALPVYPRDGTQLNGSSGKVFMVAGGAPLYVSSFDAIGGSKGGIGVDQAAIDNAGGASPWHHLRAYPADGSLLAASGGKVFIVAGGAPLYLSSWNAIGGPRPSVGIDMWDVDNAGHPDAHLRPYPADGTLLAASGGGVFVVAGGAPLYVSAWAAIGGQQPTTAIDEWDVQNTAHPDAHLRAYPAAGTFLHTSAGHVYRVAGGAPFWVSAWSMFGGEQPSVGVDQWVVDHRDNPAAHLRPAPLDGTTVRGLPSRAYWSFSAGLRSPSLAASAVDVDDAGLPAFDPVTTPGAIVTDQPVPSGDPPVAAAPAAVADAGLTGRAARCVVPRLTHLTLVQAKRRLTRAHCRLGSVSRPRRVAAGQRLRVSSQSARAGTRHGGNFAVRLRLRGYTR